jgi:hypothetical protein
MKYGMMCMNCRSKKASITIQSSIGKDRHLCEDCFLRRKSHVKSKGLKDNHG